ncbi:MAG: TolC family protein [Methylococcales bacterium]|nr:TolC family protein [Methylococcales bacterium]
MMLKQWLFVGLLAAAMAVRADLDPVVEHIDPITPVPGLTLAQVLDQALARYPDRHRLAGLATEISALKERGASWLAGPVTFGVSLQEAFRGELFVSDADFTVPLWRLGQRGAEQAVAESAGAALALQQQALKLEIAGYLRTAVWQLALANVRHQQAVNAWQSARQLAEQVRLRVAAGDLPQADLLLAQTEVLAKRSKVTQAEAEIMHARKFYQILTEDTKIPTDYAETQALAKPLQEHPLLGLISAQVQRQRAELAAIEAAQSGQPELRVGINSERGDIRSNETESIKVGISIPFGGGALRAPQIAAQNLAVQKSLTERDQLYRKLRIALHEAEHALEVDRAELTTANEMRDLAQQHERLSDIGFKAGEIDLSTLLKSRRMADQARLNAEQHELFQLRDTAFYNQAAGELP